MDEKKIREAIEVIKANYPTSGYYMLRESLDIAIEALGKQLPKKVEYEGGFSNNGFTRYRMAKCPDCDRWHSSRDEIIYCSKCGRKLDWSKEDEQRNPF